jgi:hypothetical protein
MFKNLGRHKNFLIGVSLEINKLLSELIFPKQYFLKILFLSEPNVTNLSLFVFFHPLSSQNPIFKTLNKISKNPKMCDST